MGTEIPIWLGASYVQKILRNIENDDSIEVKNFSAKSATVNGENYLSDIYRITFDVIGNPRNSTENTSQKSWIAKIVPSGEFCKEMVLDAKFYETEILMVKEIMPRINAILGQINSTTFGARHLHTDTEPVIHLIMEDLRQKGFELNETRKGLDLQHCLLALRKLAMLHAGSVALAEEDLQCVAGIKRGMFHKDHPASEVAFVTLCCESLGRETAKWPELSPGISKKILTLSKVLYERAAEAVLFREDDFNVLNHGDYRSNNMLFLYDERKNPIDLKLVDFQMSAYGSPAVDLLYFLGSTPADELREHKRELLLREYHKTLLSVMDELNCKTKPPSFEELSESLKERMFYEVAIACVILPMILVSKDDQQSINEMMQADGSLESPGCKTEIYRKVMTRLLPLYDSMGLLDS